MSASKPTAPLEDHPPATAIGALRAVERAWNAAALHWDVEGLTALYAEDATMFAGRPGMARGTEGVRGYFASYVGMLMSTQLELVDQVITELGADAFLAQGYGQFRFTLGNGKETGTTLRTTWLLVRRGDRWLIAHHHFSATPETPPVPQ
jgi:uncharacterized protein (TIGR02246 family)